MVKVRKWKANRCLDCNKTLRFENHSGVCSACQDKRETRKKNILLKEQRKRKLMGLPEIKTSELGQWIPIEMPKPKKELSEIKTSEFKKCNFKH